MPQNDFTRKMNYFDTFTKIAEEWGRFGQIIVAKVQKSPNLVTLVVVAKWSACSPSTLTIQVEQFVFEKNENKQNNDWATEF